MPHNKRKFDHICTPAWFLRLFEGFHDPFPLGHQKPIPPKPGDRIFANPGYSSKEQAAAMCIDWHKQGHYVVMLVPIESSTHFTKRLIQYGVERLYFERRIFPNCRGVELLILTGTGRRRGDAALRPRQVRHEW